VVLALAVGSVFALSLSRPVTALAEAAGRVAEGDFEAPLPSSRVEELDRLAGAFRSMRERLQARLLDLAAANRELEERQRRLHDLQAELIRQDRLSSSARLVAELAHEIRNPVANVRNCLEVVRRGLPPGADAARFADLAIDELLRMHELAESLLDLNRPFAPESGDCDPREVASQVAALSGAADGAPRVALRSGAHVPRAGIPPDALKQILFNLVQNAREADASGRPIEIVVTAEVGVVSIDVEDRGRGIPVEVLERLFDPFFTTKEAVTGVGLGLFVAEGLARRYGGRMEAANRDDGRGARCRVVVPVAVVTEGAEGAEGAGGA
jgi:signal transduction histidine kinase